MSGVARVAFEELFQESATFNLKQEKPQESKQ